MPPKNHVIAAILEASIQTAQARGASKETIALGLVAALSRLHAVVKEASEPMARDPPSDIARPQLRV